MSGASEKANERASGPILQSVFMVVLVHSELPMGYTGSGSLGQLGTIEEMGTALSDVKEEGKGKEEKEEVEEDDEEEEDDDEEEKK